jgi:Spy/CpxP family protein refolding chaperone
MRHRTIAVIVGTVLLVAACGVAHEHRRQGGARWFRQHALEHVDQVLDGVEASDDQRARARAIVGKALTDLEPWPAAAQRLRGDLTAAWRTDTPDRHALHARVDAEVESLRALGHALVDDGLELHDVLTSEQREALARGARRSWR